jgi:hypothetical protein
MAAIVRDGQNSQISGTHDAWERAPRAAIVRTELESVYVSPDVCSAAATWFRVPWEFRSFDTSL